MVRSLAALDDSASDGTTTPAESSCPHDVVLACQELEAALGDPRLFGLLEGSLLGAEHASDLRSAWEHLPDPLRRPGGELLHVREPALAYADALAAYAPRFLATKWPGEEKTLLAARETLERAFPPALARVPDRAPANRTDLLRELETSLGMADPSITIPVVLVRDAPSPGGFTYRVRGGTVSFVSIRDRGRTLPEVVLHEALHALDAQTPGQDHALNTLRHLLRERGLTDDDPRLRTLPHTLFFVEAAEMVRRHFDPGAPHYGDVSGYYRRVGPAAELVRKAWTRYLDGELEQEVALREIASGG